MEFTSTRNFRVPAFSIQPPTFYSCSSPLPFTSHSLSLPLRPIPNDSYILRAHKRNTEPDPVLNPEAPMDHEEEEFEDDGLMDGDDFLDDESMEDGDFEVHVGDGGGGGGIVLAGTSWDKEALRIAEEVCLSLDGELKIYAFKTLSNSTIKVRIERLTTKSGSPTLEDIEDFSTTYRAKLGEAELAKTIPENIALEVSSPGVERVVRIPEDLDRFKERPMYVKYIREGAGVDSTSESDGIFRLISFDMEAKCCTWGMADVRINREKAGKGRPLNKKQREWRLSTPFQSLRVVRLYSGM